MFASLLPVLVAAAGGTVAFAVVRRHGWDRLPSAGAAVALAPAFGFGLLSLSFFFWVFAGFAPPGRLTLVALTGLLAVAFAVPVACGVARRSAPDRTRRTSAIEWQAGWPRAALLLILLWVGMCLVLLVWTLQKASAAQPFGGWDAWAIWNARSLLLYRAPGGLDEIYPLMKEGHPDYPLLLPGALAAQYCLLGAEDVAIPQVTGLLFVLGTGAALLLASWRLGSATAGVAAVAVLWSTPAFWRWAFAQYADIPLSYLLLVAAAALASQLEAEERRRLPPLLAGFCLGLLTWIKNEGLVLAMLLAAVFAVVLLITARPFGGARPSIAAGRELLRRLPWIAAGALPPLVALGLFKSFWSPRNETALFLDAAVAKLLSVDRWRPVLAAFYRELNPWSGVANWGLLWPFIIVCGLVFWRRRAAAGAPALFLGCALMMIWITWLVVYVCTPASQVWHLNSSLNRLLLQVTPLTLAWALTGAFWSRETPT